MEDEVHKLLVICFVSPLVAGSAAFAGQALKPVPSTYDGVHQFVVGDQNMTATDVDKTVGNIDFIWAGDTYTSKWNQSSATIVGHYIGVNSAGSEDYARCVQTSDCLQQGYVCTPFSYPNVRAAYRYVDTSPQHKPEPVCRPVGPFAQCGTTDADCVTTYTDTGPSGTETRQINGVCSGGQCYMSDEQKRTAEFKYWRNLNPDWILYTNAAAKGVLPGEYDLNVAWFDGSPQVPFDFTNTNAQNGLLGRIRYWEHLPDGTNATYDVLSADALYPANYHGAAGVFRNHVWTPLFEGDQRFSPTACPDPNDPANSGYCDSAYTLALVAWLQQLRDDMHQDGLRLVVNIGYSGSIPPYAPIPPTNTTLLKIFDIVDGVFDEGGFTRGLQRQAGPSSCVSYSFNGTYNCPGGLAGMLDLWSNMGGPKGYIRSVQKRSKPYYNKSFFGYSQSHPGSPDPDATEWALASHLLAREFPKAGGAEAIYVSGVPDSAFVSPLPAQLAVAIGHPCQDIIHLPQSYVFVRKYSHGFVAANADGFVSTPPPTVPLPSGATFLRWNGTGYLAPVSSSLTLPYQTGVVLYSANAKLCP
jgi:hypothetical protein